jgi:hypothetical protein
MRVFHEAVLDEILERRVASSRGRRSPRGVKRKMSSYPLRKRVPSTRLPDEINKLISIFK